MSRERSLVRGAVAGMAGGLVASWVMNEFLVGPGKKLRQAVQSNGHQRNGQQNQSQDEDATMKAADLIASTATGGQHLSPEAREKAAPVVHYGFGSVTGALYGAIVEVWPGARSGLGTTFGSTLFAAADLVAVPALKLGPGPTEQPASAEASPLAAHVVYGVTTELVRRMVRAAL